MAAAHASYFLALGEQAEVGLHGSSQERWFGVLRAEHANLRAALSWMVATDGQVDQAQAGRFGLASTGIWAVIWKAGRCSSE